MNKEFDFDEIGKRMPYRTPEAFFEDNRREILDRTCGEEPHKRNRIHAIIPAMLVAAALLTGILFMPLLHEESDRSEPSDFVLMAETESGNSEMMDNAIASLSDEELQELAELSETDIFLF